MKCRRYVKYFFTIPIGPNDLAILIGHGHSIVCHFTMFVDPSKTGSLKFCVTDIHFPPASFWICGAYGYELDEASLEIIKYVDPIFVVFWKVVSEFLERSLKFASSLTNVFFHTIFSGRVSVFTLISQMGLWEEKRSSMIGVDVFSFSIHDVGMKSTKNLGSLLVSIERLVDFGIE